MSSIPPPTVGFSPGESDLLDQYRSISWLAVTSLVLGAASCTVLFSPLLCWLPILAVALGVVAQRSIRQQQPRLAGRAAALCGVALALFFGTWGLSQATLRRAIICRQARNYAQQWLELVQAGRLLEAHQLHLPRDQRLTPQTSADGFYRQNQEMRRNRDTFFESPPLKAIIRVGTQGRLRFQGDEGTESEWIAKNRLDYVSQRFAFDYEEDGRPQTVSFFVIMTRRPNRTAGEVTWEVRDVSLPRAGDS
jgi:hypothetical protein